MKDYSKLVEALRCEELKGIACPDCYERECIANSGKGLYCRVPQLLEDAAAAIEALQDTVQAQDKALKECARQLAKMGPKRGEWYTELYDGDKKYQCSNCLTHWDVETRYCPFCGAKMEVQE